VRAAVLQSAVAVVLWRRKLHNCFGIFRIRSRPDCIFCAHVSITSADNYEWFFYSYWAGAAVSALLSFRVIHEIFLDFFVRTTCSRSGTCCSSGLACDALVSCRAFSNSAQSDPLVQRNDAAALGTMVQCGLILFLLLFLDPGRFARHRASHRAGFGLFASVELILIALNSGAFSTSHASACEHCDVRSRDSSLADLRDHSNAARMAVQPSPDPAWSEACRSAYREWIQSHNTRLLDPMFGHGNGHCLAVPIWAS